jgi:hypothetical protein
VNVSSSACCKSILAAHSTASVMLVSCISDEYDKTTRTQKDTTRLRGHRRIQPRSPFESPIVLMCLLWEFNTCAAIPMRLFWLGSSSNTQQRHVSDNQIFYIWYLSSGSTLEVHVILSN